jgi:hypothetical protein
VSPILRTRWFTPKMATVATAASDSCVSRESIACETMRTPVAATTMLA